VPGAADAACDASLAAGLRVERHASLVLAREFRTGQPLSLANDAGASQTRAAQTSAAPTSAVATADLCLVKVLVGPGVRGSVDAPSTSAGIGVEVWLPAPSRWNGRVHAFGANGWAGGPAGRTDAIAAPYVAAAAAREGAATSISDAGHSITGTGAFGLTPRGTLNGPLWRDYADRAAHVQAVVTKALAAAYYGRAPHHAYWQGGATGGRQGLALAQLHPRDFDGIVVGNPGVHLVRFMVAGLYPQLVMRDPRSGGTLTREQLDLASNAAIAACDRVGDAHLGYVLDAASCAYDPTRDPDVLCTNEGGHNAGSACLSRAQAAAVNRIWYGMTVDGTAPEPAIDPGWPRFAPNGRPSLPVSPRRWYGLPRGTSLYGAAFTRSGTRGLAHPDGAFDMASTFVALAMEDPTLADPPFAVDAASRWRELSFAGLARAFDRGVAGQRSFGNIDGADPDLRAFARAGGRLLMWHGVADELVPAQGSVVWFERMAARGGGVEAARTFSRFYLVPGVGHGPANGTSNTAAAPPSFTFDQPYELLVRWVEQGDAPEDIVVRSAATGATRPVCPYPRRIAYVGGDPWIAASYACR
jgi:hypothetical protein